MGQNLKEKTEEDLTSYRLKYRRNILDGYLSEYIKQKCVEISENANYFKIIFRKDENKLEFSCISRRFLLPLQPIRNVKGKLFLWDYEYNEAEK